MTDIDDLAAEINRRLAQYANGVGEKVEKAAEESSKSAVKKLKKESPEETGDYRKGWRRKKIDDTWVVYNKTDWQLAHLLEEGHAKRNGGRTDPIVHIQPVREEVIEDLLSVLEEVAEP